MARKFERHSLPFLMKKTDNINVWDFPEKIQKDISKVEFDFENYEYVKGSGYNGCKDITGYNVTSHGLPYWGWVAGGDWEMPVFFIIYWDGKNLRGYIPKDGNTWNTDTKKAYGNDYGSNPQKSSDAVNIKKRWPKLFKGYDLEDIQFDDCPECDPKLILADIEKRIKPKK
jgi:hypothetical protein